MKNDAPAEEKARGFAAMDAATQKEIASKGGKAAHQKGTAHEFSSAEAREAGRKGGEAISEDRAHMAEIGAEGGRSRAGHRGARSRGTKAKKSSGQRGAKSQSHAKTGRMSHKATR